LLVRHSFASGHASQWTCADAGGRTRRSQEPPRFQKRGACAGPPLCRAEGEGFEPSSDPKVRNGFRDRADVADLQGFSQPFASKFASAPMAFVVEIDNGDSLVFTNHPVAFVKLDRHSNAVAADLRSLRAGADRG
jgi:hypothetical protein